MSHAAQTHDHGALVATPNVTVAGAARGLGALLMLAGLGGIAVTGWFGWSGGEAEQRAAIHAYHLGFVASAALMLGSLMFVMALHQTGAAWSATIRRVFENVMSCAPLVALLFIPTAALVIVKPGLLWHWMDAHAVAGDVLYEKKRAFLNVPFFMIRAGVYFAVWIGLAATLRRLSLRQDVDHDKWKTWWMRRISAPGLLAFALTAAFAGFDWLMSLDYHFFSTMFGVYFFAISILSTLAFGVLTLLALRASGRLEGIVTSEHLHDLGKLLFGFTVFWGYIAFSQYFLIWYANIPEETAYLAVRREGEWLNISRALAIGKFIIPFLVLLPRPSRRNPAILTLVCLWILTMTLVDLFWVIRPELSRGATLDLTWVDFVGPAGPLMLFVGFFLLRTASAPLIPLGDPRLGLSLHHKNHI